MSRPTCVTVLNDNRLYVEINSQDSPKRFLDLGFVNSTNYQHVYWYERSDPNKIYSMCNTMRDMGIPFKTNRHGGADYMLEAVRNEGHVSGKFLRLNFFDNDTDENAPYRLEEF